MSTGIKASFLDIQLNLTAYPPEKKTLFTFSILGINKISSYLAKVFSTVPSEEHTFHTYVLPNKLICNIVFVVKDNNYVGAFVTEPMLLHKLTREEIEKLIKPSERSLKNITALENTISKIPITKRDRIASIGNVLYTLSKTLFEEKAHQVLIKHDIESEIKNHYKVPNHKYNFSSSYLEENYSASSKLKEIIDLIKDANTELLENVLNKINSQLSLLYNLYDRDFIRYIKNYFIKICSIASYIAIEENIPWQKVVNIADNYISQIEKSKNLNDIYELIKEGIISITNLIKKYKNNTYSKHVRRAMNYIETHYSEKITLDILSDYTKISTFYLSKQIKKETGLSLLDNINRIRIEKSKGLLTDTNESILDIAQKVGFSYQNHFSAVFKKLTNFSPSEFRSTLGKANASKEDLYSKNNISSSFIEKIYNKLSTFSNLFDSARIINPITHDFMSVKLKSSTNYFHRCTNNLKQAFLCENCISRLAYIRNDTVFKIDNRLGDTFLMMAVPVSDEKSTYIVELWKNISDKILFNINQNNIKNYFANTNLYSLGKKDNITGLYTRGYIDKKLDMDMRRSNFEGSSLFIILLVIENDNSTMNNLKYTADDSLLKTLANIISSSLITPKDWAGRYAGNVFLLTLNDFNYATTLSTAEKIKERFKRTLSELNENYRHLKLKYGIKGYSNDVDDSETFIRHALINIDEDE